MNLKVLVAAVVLLACAMSPVARAGSLTNEVIGIFPRDAGQFAYVDLLQARYLTWFPELRKQVLPDQLTQFEKFLASPGMDTSSQVAQVEGLAWEVVPSEPRLQASQNSGVPTSEEFIIVALGQFSPESTEAYFKAQKREVVKVRDYSLYPIGSGSGGGGLFFCFMNSSAAVLGGRKELERVIAVSYGEEQNLLSNTELAPLISQANGRSMVWAVLSASHAWQAMQQFAPLLEQFRQSQQLFSTLRALTLEIDAGTGIRSRLEAVCASSDDANAFAAILQAGLLYQGYQAGKSNQGVAALLDQAQVAPSGDRLDLTLTLTDDQVVGLLQQNGLSIHQ